MASIETNDRKRNEMSAHVARLRKLGWTTADLAVWMDVTPGTVANWHRGGSMGTNAQRAQLSELRSPTATIPLIQRTIDDLEREATELDEAAQQATFADAHEVAKWHKTRLERARARIAALRKLAGG